MRRALLAAALVVGLAGCGSSGGSATLAGSKGTAAPVDIKIGGQPAQVWPASNASRAVVYVHGRGQDQHMLGGPQAAIITQLHDEGWTIGSDAAHYNAWGDARSVADYQALIRYLRAQEHISTVVLLGASMGGLASLHLLRDGDASTAVLVSPVTNLAAMYDVPLAIPEVTNVWGPSAPKSADPQQWPRSALHGDDVTVISAPDDPYVLFQRNAQAFADKFGAKLITCHGGHAVPACFAKVSFS